MIRWILFCFIGLAQLPARAQDTLVHQEQPALQQKKQKVWLKPAIGLAYAGATLVCYRHLDTRIKTFSQDHQSGFGDLVFHTTGPLGLGKTQSIELASTTALAFILRDQQLKRTVITWAGGLLINSELTDQLKKTFQRHRPNTGDPYNTFDWRGGSRFHKSFPSAHTSTAFTTATVWSTIYKDKHWVPFVAYGLASMVGLSRIYDNAHWASDVMAGAAVGFLSAKAMNGLYKLASKKILFLPQVGKDEMGITMVYMGF